MGTVVHFERQPSERMIASRYTSTSLLRRTLGIEVERIEEAISKCGTALVSVNKLLKSVQELEKAKLNLSEPSVQEAFERLFTSVRLQLPSGLAGLANSLLAVGAAIELVSKTGDSPKHIIANPDHAEA